jgi:hypothetical protein
VEAVKVIDILDLRSAAQVEAFWELSWRLKLAGNAKAKAAEMRVSEWHMRTATANVVQMRETPAFLRRQAS